MSKFLKLTYGDRPILVNIDQIETVFPRTPGDPKSGCTIELSGAAIGVDETFRTIKGRLTKLDTDTNDNPDTNTNNEVDN